MRGLRPRPDGEEQQRQVKLMLNQAANALPAQNARGGSSKFATMIVDTPILPKKDT